jgi:hypothetical protein
MDSVTRKVFREVTKCSKSLSFGKTFLHEIFFYIKDLSKRYKNVALNLKSWGRVARWHIFKPKIPIWVNFGGPWKGKGWYILYPFQYITVIRYILSPFCN